MTADAELSPAVDEIATSFPFMKRGLLMVLAVAALAAGIFVCKRQQPAPSDPGAAAPPSPTGAAPAASGTVSVKGSDTMVILAQRWAETYMRGKPDTVVQVTGGGSGTGISALINGTTDIASSSREMKEPERKQVEARPGAGAAKEIPVAKDGVSVFVNQANPIASITFDQLQGIYQGKIASWKELGGKDQKIVVYSRENSSGTYVFFKEHVLKGADFTQRAQTLPGTAAVVNAIGKDPAGIGYGGIAYGEGIKLVPIVKQAGGQPIAPTPDTIKDGSYPLSRPLFFYTRGEPQGPTKDFVDWVLSPAGQDVVEAVGYFKI